MLLLLFLLWPGACLAQSDADGPLRGAIPRAKAPPRIDGKLDEYAAALCTPVEYFHSDLKNRPGQFFYLWDHEAFYVGVRTLDETPFTPEEFFWVGDAVEWYFDARRGGAFLSRNWGPGALHCFFAGVHQGDVKPRFTLRPGYEDAIPKTGVEVASGRTEHGLEIEFKLPWVNFPEFQPAPGEVIGIDAELSYSDGISRSFRTFAFGGPLSVERPANLARVVLVNSLDVSHWKFSGPVMMPIRIDVPWQQEGKPHVEARIAMPPYGANAIGGIVFKLQTADGQQIGEFAATREEVIQADGNFLRRVASWPLSVAPAGAYSPVAVVTDSDGKELARIAPRLASVNMEQGY